MLLSDRAAQSRPGPRPPNTKQSPAPLACQHWHWQCCSRARPAAAIAGTTGRQLTARLLTLVVAVVLVQPLQGDWARGASYHSHVPAPPEESYTNVFHSGIGGFPCVRVPSLLAVPGVALLAFAECRSFAGDGCLPANASAYTQDIEARVICMRRSTTRGATWEPLVGNLSGVNLGSRIWGYKRFSAPGKE